MIRPGNALAGELLDLLIARGGKVREACRSASGTPRIFCVTVEGLTVEIHDRSVPTWERLEKRPVVRAPEAPVPTPASVEAPEEVPMPDPTPPIVRVTLMDNPRKADMAAFVAVILTPALAGAEVSVDGNVVEVRLPTGRRFTLTVSIPREGGA